jgi:hypothetical protein
MTQTNAQSDVGRWPVAAAIFAFVCNLLCVVLVNYQNYLLNDALVLNYPEIFSDCFLLTPLLVGIIFYRVAAITLPYALMLSVILAGRIYYLVQFHRVGLIAFVPKMDLPGFGLILLAGVSLLILLISALSFAAHRRQRMQSYLVLLLAVLCPAQAQRAYSDESSAPGVSSVNDCTTDSADSDLKAGLRKLAETVTEKTAIPAEFLERHFAGCTIENARKLLVKNGFAADKLGPEFDDGKPEKVIPRRMMTAKTIRLIGQHGSLNCRIIFQTDPSNRVSVQRFFYLDGP